MTRSLLVVLCAVLGCGRISEVKKCRALAARVNPTFDQIEARLKKEQGARAYRDAAASYRKLSKELAAGEVGIARIEQPVKDFSASLAEAAAASERLAQAVENGDAAKKLAAHRELGTNARLHRAIASRIDDICRGH